MADHLLRQIGFAKVPVVSKQRAHQLARGESFPPAVRAGGTGLLAEVGLGQVAKHPVGDRRWSPQKVGPHREAVRRPEHGAWLG